MSLNDKIRYLKYLNLVLNVVFHLYSSLIRNKLYTFDKFKVINYRILINLFLNSMMNNKK